MTTYPINDFVPVGWAPAHHMVQFATLFVVGKLQRWAGAHPTYRVDFL
jgi:hypothetical protein